MDKITMNEIVYLDNGKQFLCFQIVNHEGTEYIYLISTTKPIEICLAKQKSIDGSLRMSVIEDKEEKLFALKLFQDDYNNK